MSLMEPRSFSAGGRPIYAPDELGEVALATRAHRDAMRHIAQDIPDPAEYARQIPLLIAELLLTANSHHGAYRVSIEVAKLLRPYSLVEANHGQYLTAFGCKVLRALKDEDA